MFLLLTILIRRLAGEFNENVDNSEKVSSELLLTITISQAIRQIKSN